MVRQGSHWRLIAVVLGMVVGVEVVTSILPKYPGTILNDSAQLSAGLGAVICSAIFASKAQGWERNWRLFSALAFAGWSTGQCIWSWYQIVKHVDTPSPSWADAGYLSIVPFALVALAIFARNGTSPTSSGEEVGTRLPGALLIVDSLLIVSSLFLLTWTTALGATVRQTGPQPFALAIAIAYPATDLTLVAMVFLIYMTRRILRDYREQLSLLGFGLIGLALSDSVFSYLVSSGIHTPLVGDVGFIFGPAFVALAVAEEPKSRRLGRSRRAEGSSRWFRYLAPCVPLAVAVGIVVYDLWSGQALDLVEVAAASSIAGLVILRQAIALVYALKQRSGAIKDIREDIRTATDRAVGSTVHGATPGYGREFETEISEVSASLALSFERLLHLGRRAEEFGTVVRTLVERAEEARTAAELNEEDARRLSALIESRIGTQFVRQFERMRRSSNSVALWTFVGGVMLGTLGNVVVALAIR